MSQTPPENDNNPKNQQKKPMRIVPMSWVIIAILLFITLHLAHMLMASGKN